MTRIAVSGHMNLTQSSVAIVSNAITDVLTSYTAALTGISCLARGADSIFAQAVLDLGGELEVVLPAETYRAKKVKSDHAAQFDDLMRRATTVRVLPYSDANREAYEAANEVLMTTCDTLLAVWDGKPEDDKGGTASVVKDARERGIPVHVIWPAGAEREGSRP